MLAIFLMPISPSLEKKGEFPSIKFENKKVLAQIIPDPNSPPPEVTPTPTGSNDLANINDYKLGCSIFDGPCRQK